MNDDSIFVKSDFIDTLRRFGIIKDMLPFRHIYRNRRFWGDMIKNTV